MVNLLLKLMEFESSQISLVFIITINRFAQLTIDNMYIFIIR